MKTVSIKEENVRKAHQGGCDDVKQALEDLFPEVLKTLDKDITKELHVRLKKGGDDGVVIQLLHKGVVVGDVKSAGIRTKSRYEISTSPGLVYYFRIFEIEEETA